MISMLVPVSMTKVWSVVPESHISFLLAAENRQIGSNFSTETLRSPNQELNMIGELEYSDDEKGFDLDIQTLRYHILPIRKI